MIMGFVLFSCSLVGAEETKISQDMEALLAEELEEDQDENENQDIITAELLKIGSRLRSERVPPSRPLGDTRSPSKLGATVSRVPVQHCRHLQVRGIEPSRHGLHALTAAVHRLPRRDIPGVPR